MISSYSHFFQGLTYRKGRRSQSFFNYEVNHSFRICKLDSLQPSKLNCEALLKKKEAESGEVNLDVLNHGLYMSQSHLKVHCSPMKYLGLNKKCGGWFFTVGEGVCVWFHLSCFFFFCRLMHLYSLCSRHKCRNMFLTLPIWSDKSWFLRKKLIRKWEKKILNMDDCTQYLYIIMIHASFENISFLFSLLLKIKYLL